MVVACNEKRFVTDSGEFFHHSLSYKFLSLTRAGLVHYYANTFLQHSVLHSRTPMWAILKTDLNEGSLFVQTVWFIISSSRVGVYFWEIGTEPQIVFDKVI